MSNFVHSKGYHHGKAVPYVSPPRLTASLFTLVVSLVLCLQLLLPSAAHAATASSPSKFCSSGTHSASRYSSWTDKGKTDYYYGSINYDINSSCTQVTLNTAVIEYTSSPAFVSWWDHNQYVNGRWGTGCPIVSKSGNLSNIDSGGWQAGYYFQEYVSDNGCNIFNENLVYTNIGPLTD